MLERLLKFIAPHYCCGCDKIGSLLCYSCKYDITDEVKTVCIVCQKPSRENGLCAMCQLPYERAWFVGERTGLLQRLIGLYKFERAAEAHRQLTDLLDDVLPVMPSDTVIVPVPTTPGRVRERGYDHMLLIARRLAKIRGLKYKPLIKRQGRSKQRQASAAKRNRQASTAFYVDVTIDPDAPYLIVDDVMTTGATVKYAAKALKDAGAQQVWLVVIARQTLD